MKVSRLILEDLKIHEEKIGKEMGAKFQENVKFCERLE